MKTRTIALLCSTAALLPALAALDRGPVAAAAQETPIQFPNGYRSWMHVKSTLIGPHAPEANRGFHHFYANDLGVAGYRTGTFPDGAVLVDDGLAAHDEQGVTMEGARRRVAVMIKDRARFADTEGWGFEVFAGDAETGSLSVEGRQQCLECHSRAEGDLVYSRLR